MTNLSELKPVAEALNAQTNEVNLIISDINAKLEALNLGISVGEDGVYLNALGWEVERNENGEPTQRTRTVYYLGYAKLHDKWQLALVNCEESQGYVDGRPEKTRYGDDETESGEVFFTALTQAPRHLRIKSLGAVEQLIGMLKARAEEDVKTIETARQAAAKL